MITTEQIHQLPEYTALTKARNKVVWPLSVLVIGVYFSFILVIAFKPALLGVAVGAGVTSWGVVMGLAIIVFCLVITGIYVYYANTVLEPMTKAIVAKVHAENTEAQ